MKRWLIVFFCPSIALAQNVQITEITPHTLAHQPEWFEFRVSGTDTVDMTDWHISNGKNKPKPLADFIETLAAGEGASKTENEFIFDLNQTGYFSFSPSPIGLPNNGGIIQILDPAGQILSALDYPKAASRSTKNYEEREVLTWDEATQSLIPQPVRAPETPGYQASKGKANPPLPTQKAQFKAVINEVSVDHDETDFIEIFIVSGPEKINLQYTELKHNGTSLWRFETPYLVSPGDYLVFRIGTPDHGKVGHNVFHSNAREGLSGGSGTVEIINMSATSQENQIDVLCWQKSDLSKTESKRVQKFITAEQWKDSCVSIQALIPNESIARFNPAQDANTAADWFRHFNGSLGQPNETKNHPPKAVITLQGTKKSVAPVSFLLNPTGENSTDEDGPKDLKSYEWTFNGTVISSKANPAGFYVETEGEHELRLTVTDQSGATSTISQLIVGVPPGGRNTNKGSAKAQAAIIETLLETAVHEQAAHNEPAQDDFFMVFMNRPHWTESLLASAQTSQTYPAYKTETLEKISPPLYEENWSRQINLPKPVRHRLKKNLGLLFSWRESPWPDLAAEWTAVVTADRTSGYFDSVYRGF